ncbi:Nicotinamide-nucleotide amidase [Nocardia seriolae]|uniref:Competence protein n=1 Tax=Nocardia seriolae TaxID=37332 RepID=A0ABC8B1H6_9NOCA|nr:Nicotinamide-nucleotide amidase [Nocardia seriolae]BAW08421.1 competence protein [Nocardia seriolae]GAM45150.1 competence protein [Nocardia seriolae]GAP27172.1 competence protein [Nocardia seriolae]GEM23033.1 competence protein [Nocardia seriolae NBRC 15557]
MPRRVRPDIEAALSRVATAPPVPADLATEVPAAELVAALIAAGQTVATAESLTAGLLSATIAGIPGASAVLRGGLIVYATDLKHSLAGVSADTLATDGPVAASTAEQLAVGARRRCESDWGIGLTGVAGPEPQDGRPVGTVFIGIAGPRSTEVLRLKLSGDRWTIRVGAVRAAVTELVRSVRGE